MSTEKYLLIISTLWILVSNQNHTLLYSPYRGQDISICFSDCYSCTLFANSVSCQVCLEPFFEKDQNGQCNLKSQYQRESTAEEQRYFAFERSSSWIVPGGTVPQERCNAMNQQFDRIGPFSNEQLRYTRRISQHNYFGMKFMLVLQNWCPFCTLNITLENQDGTLLDWVEIKNNESTTNFDKIKKQKVCTEAQNEQLLSLAFVLEQEKSSKLLLEFTPSNLTSGARWSIITFFLATGKCNDACDTCSNFTSNIENCQICKNFLRDTNTEKCSSCESGFYRFSETRCLKCPIEYQECENDIQKCWYEDEFNLTQQCQIQPDNLGYEDRKYANDLQFSASLFSEQGKGASIFHCGSYSVVGLASRGKIISEQFAFFPGHIAFSLSFNILIVDQVNTSENYTIMVYLNDRRIPDFTKTLNFLGYSNECGDSSKRQVFVTYFPSPFYPHYKTSGVKVGIALDSVGPVQWGIRDIRFLFKRCDEDCEECGENTCKVCSNLIQINPSSDSDTTKFCAGCIATMSFFNDVCNFCQENCLKCTGPTQCTECLLGFYLYRDPKNHNQTECFRKPNYHNPITSPDGWSAQEFTLWPNSSTCSLKSYSTQKVQNEPDENEFVSRNVSTMRRFQLKNAHHKVKIEYLLVKIDDWGQNQLNLFANDLLIKRYTFKNTGNRICFDEEQIEELFFEEFELKDDNTTLTIEFEVIEKDPLKSTKFALRNFKIYQISCKQCQQQNFSYKIQYTPDQFLNVLIQFNRIYKNNSPQDFKDIFLLSVNNKFIDYNITFNDTVRYWLSTNQITSQLISKEIRVICQYRDRVTTELTLSGNDNMFVDRRLQVTTDNTKAVETETASVTLRRFTPLKNAEAMRGLSTFFAFVSRAVIYIGLILFFLGLQTGWTHVMHNFQKIWAHIYVGSLLLSPTLKVALQGFREVQNQNIAINPSAWQSGIPSPLYYPNLPAQYQLYYQDNTFFRNIYNVAIIAFILTITYICVHFLIKKLINDHTENKFLRHLRITFVKRQFFYFNSLLFYQYFTVCLACALQFLHLTSQTDVSAFSDINAIACVAAFAYVVVYPLAHLIYLYKRKKALYGEEMEVDFSGAVVYWNLYAETFFRFHQMDVRVWIRTSQLMYNLFRFGELWWIALTVTLFYESPFTQAFILLILNALHFFFVLFSSISRSSSFRLLKCLELLMFMGIEVLILVMETLIESLQTESYETLGIVGIAFIFVIIVSSFARAAFTWHNLAQEYEQTLQGSNFYRRNLKAFTQDGIEDDEDAY